MSISGGDTNDANRIEGGTDLTFIGNINDSLKVVLVDKTTSSQGAAVDASGNVSIKASTLPLPTGAATSANQTTELASLSSIDTKLTTTNSSLATIDAGIPAALGQVAMSASMPVVLASNQTAIPVTQSGTWSITLPTGASTSANQTTEIASLSSIDTKLTTTNSSLATIDAGIPAALGQSVMSAAMPVVIASNQSAVLVTRSENTRATYSAASVGLVVPASPTDVFTITGSGTKTIRVLAVGVSGTTTAGSGTSINLSLVKRSTADTGGTSTSPVAVAYDSSSAAATASVKAYTVLPTLGTAVGTVLAARLDVPTNGAGGFGGGDNVYTFGDRPGQSIVLRSASEQLAVNLGGVTVTGPVFDIFIEWVEE